MQVGRIINAWPHPDGSITVSLSEFVGAHTNSWVIDLQYDEIENHDFTDLERGFVYGMFFGWSWPAREQL